MVLNFRNKKIPSTNSSLAKRLPYENNLQLLELFKIRIFVHPYFIKQQRNREYWVVVGTRSEYYNRKNLKRFYANSFILRGLSPLSLHLNYGGEIYTPNEESANYEREREREIQRDREWGRSRYVHISTIDFCFCIKCIIYSKVNTNTRRDETGARFGREAVDCERRCVLDLKALICYLLAFRPALAEEGGTAAAAVARYAFRLSTKDDDLDGCWSTATAGPGRGVAVAIMAVVVNDGEAAAATPISAEDTILLLRLVFAGVTFPDLIVDDAGPPVMLLLLMLLMMLPGPPDVALYAFDEFIEFFNVDLATLVPVVIVVLVVVFGTVDALLIVTLGLAWWGRWGGAVVARKARTYIVYKSELMAGVADFVFSWFFFSNSNSIQDLPTFFSNLLSLLRGTEGCYKIGINWGLLCKK